MSGKDQAEEKTLPATEKKLRDGRKKGQTSKSKDLTSGFVLLAVVVYLLLIWPTVVERSKELINLVSLTAAQRDEPLMTAMMRPAELAVTILLQTVGPLVAIITFMTVASGMIGTLGPVFAFELIKPNFDHINPAKGLERIFSMRNVVEFIKSLLKVALLLGVFVVLLAAWIQPIFQIPACGDACGGPFLLTILKYLAVTAAMAFTIIGIVDVGIQYQLFLRDMKMTRTELRREQKDIEGDPLIRSQRRSIRRRAGRESAVGIERAAFAVSDGDTLVAMRYGRGAPVPIIVAKGDGPEGALLREKAVELGIPVVEYQSFAANLMKKGKIRDYIGPEFYEPAIETLMKLNIM